MASIVQNPSEFDPYLYPEKNQKRRKEALRKMKEQGYILSLINIYGRVKFETR